MDKYPTPYESRVAEGLIRGAFMGACWGVFLPNPYAALDTLHSDNLDFPQAKEKKITSTQDITNRLKVRVSNIRYSSIGVAFFLGTYSATCCATEYALGLRPYHPLSVFTGACSAGLLLNIGARVNSPRVVFLSTVGTGAFATILQSFSAS